MCHNCKREGHFEACCRAKGAGSRETEEREERTLSIVTVATVEMRPTVTKEPTLPVGKEVGRTEILEVDPEGSMRIA